MAKCQDCRIFDVEVAPSLCAGCEAEWERWLEAEVEKTYEIREAEFKRYLKYENIQYGLCLV